MSTPTDQTSDTTENPLRDPDHTETDLRSTTFVWNLGPDPEGGTRQAILAVGHHKHSRGGSFTATLLNRTQDGIEQRMGSITDWKTLKSDPVARYSTPAEQQFASTALAELHSIYREDSAEGEKVRGYFTVNP